MAEKFRSLMKVIVGEITKHRLFNNATATINNATGRAQEKLNNMQNIVASKYDVIAKQVNHEITVIQNLNSGQLEPSPLPRRVVKWMQWYQQLTGLDTVEMAKQQVMSAQDKLFNCQDGRRQLNRQATIINDKLKEVYSELIQTKRDDPKYVQLTIVENKGLQEQARIMSQLNLLDKEEKDHFTQLATAIKEYHDSQTMNAQKYKYLSILASAGLAIISLIGSMIYNNKRIVSVRNVITEAQERNETAFRDKFNSLESNMNTRMSTILKKLDNNKKPAVTSFVNEDLDTSVLTQHLHIILGVSVILLFWKAFIG
ncbi:mitochondrial potassium channel isoform X1 [Andrena cerasifolii]|uniref:mitochondrial potassium channel isoform X1 n=1 Tax=Andrena cerasifolii TaxID=2819439 RepID=UPI004037CB92